MRISTQRKIDMKENQMNAVNLTNSQREYNRIQRNKNKASVISLETNHQKPLNRKKHPELRKPPEIGRRANTLIAKTVHGKYPHYIGLRKWPVK
jgi:hypothetical protein